MSRPTKQGIDYFPLDCQFDDKIEMYLLETNSKGLAVLITIWQMIYSNEGYYINDSKDLSLLIKKRINVNINEVIECINICLSRNIFDVKLHKKYKILTSKAIQKRYFEIIKRRKQVEVIKNYILIDKKTIVNDNILWINVNINPQNDCNKKQSKVKESKGEESKGEKPFVEQDSTIDEIILYLNEKTEKNFKLTTVECRKLIRARLKDYSIEEIKTVVDKKCKQWLNDPRNDKYLRWETLFNANKFESYINEKDIEEINQDERAF